MSTLRVKRFARLPAEMLDVLQVIPAAVHPKVGACLESPLLCYLMSGSGLFQQGRQAQMGVCEASLPRLTAQGLLRSARHPSPDNNFPDLTSMIIRLLRPPRAKNAKLQCKTGPFMMCRGLCVCVCVALCLGFHHILGFSPP